MRCGALARPAPPPLALWEFAAAREQGTTVILVTHEARVAAYADREVIVRDGKVTSLFAAGGIMIAFGLRLTLRGGSEAAARLLVTAAAVALGVGLLLVTLAAINGVNTQNLRNAWLNSGVPGATSAGATPSPDPLWGTVCVPSS